MAVVKLGCSKESRAPGLFLKRVAENLTWTQANRDGVFVIVDLDFLFGELYSFVEFSFACWFDVESYCSIADLLLLPRWRRNTFGKPHSHAVWGRIVERVGWSGNLMQGVSPRACKERAEKVVRQARAKDNWRARQSGTEEQFTEKERLLLVAVELVEERVKNAEKQAARGSKEKEDKDRAAAVRDGALKTFGSKRRRSLNSEQVEISEDEDGLFAEDRNNGRPAPVPRKKKARQCAAQSSTETIVKYLNRKGEKEDQRRQDEMQQMREEMEEDKRRENSADQGYLEDLWQLSSLRQHGMLFSVK